MEAFAGLVGLVTFFVSIIALIAFFITALNVEKCVKILRAILKELQDANDPIKQKAKKFDAGNI